MSKAIAYPSYAEILAAIDTNVKKNAEIMTKTASLLGGTILSLTYAKESLKDLSYQSMERIAMAPANIRESPLSPLLQTLMDDVLHPTSALELSIGMLEKVRHTLTVSSIEYETRAKEIIEKATGSLRNLDEVTSVAASTHEAYVQAGANVKRAFETKSSKLQDARHSFVAAQRMAVEAHNKMNSMRGIVTTQFAETLSDFESLEAWRADVWKNVLEAFSEGTELSTAQYFMLANQVNAIVTKAEAEVGGDAFNIDFMKDAVSEERYQPVIVPRAACRFLDMQEVFKNDLSRGGKLYRVVTDSRGAPDELDVRGDEIVCALEDRGERRLCKNINDCVGLVSSQLLQPV